MSEPRDWESGENGSVIRIPLPAGGQLQVWNRGGPTVEIETQVEGATESLSVPSDAIGALIEALEKAREVLTGTPIVTPPRSAREDRTTP